MSAKYCNRKLHDIYQLGFPRLQRREKHPLIHCKFNNCDCEGIESLIRPLSVPFLFCGPGKKSGKIRKNMGVLNWLCAVAKSTYLEFCPDTGLSEFMTQLGGMSHFTSLQ